jgi:hypothetical protein
MTADPTYPPLNRLKSVAKDVWIVDGPVIRFGMLWPKMPFPTRITIIRLAGGDLFIHSPTPLPPELGEDIKSIGRPRWILGPNRIHYWWIPDWHAAFPEANVYLAPRIREQSDARIDFDGLPLDGSTGYPWDVEMGTLPVTGSYMTEVVFFTVPAGTLVLTDSGRELRAAQAWHRRALPHMARWRPGSRWLDATATCG